MSVTSGNLSGVNTTTQGFDSQNLNDENIRQYLQNHLDTHVGTLRLRYNQLTDLSWISDFSQLDTLKELDVRGNRIKSFSWDDIPPLTEKIVLWENNLVSLPHIGKHNTCVHVKTFGLGSNQLENLECSNIPHTVVRLYLPGNNMKSVCDMSHLQLTKLSLHHNQLENMECSHIPHTVEWLYLSHNKLKTLCDLTLFTQLRELYLNNNHLTTVSADHLPPSLQTIYLRNNLFDCVNIKQSLSVSVECNVVYIG